ncbi:MAG: S8 family serine peptidase [Candidatus Kariarchaeaceae archaeon]|jgi:hypothetical protein
MRNESKLVLGILIGLIIFGQFTIMSNYPNTSQTSSRNVSQLDSPNSIAEKIESYESKTTPEILEYLETGNLREGIHSDRVLIISTSRNTYSSQKIPPMPLAGSYLHITSNQSPQQLRDILEDPKVKYVLFDSIVDQTLSSTMPSNNAETQSFIADDILGTRKVWETYNITGEGVSIGIVDTGIDFGISDLSESAVLLPSGITASFDPTGVSIGITSLNVTPIIRSSRSYLPIQGKNLTLWEGEYRQYSNTADIGIELSRDLDITGISKTSKSGFYQVGLMFQPGLVETIPNQYFLFVLVDSSIEHYYDTIYVDFDTSLAITLARAGLIFESSNLYLSLYNWNLFDETPFDNSNPIVARDITGDGVNDISLGGLATTLDLYDVLGRVLIEGIDPSGLGISVMYDPIGHGTLDATAAVSAGKVEVPVYDNKLTQEVENGTTYTLPGSAPNAKIIATKASGQSLSDFILGWYWVAGLELSCWPENLLDPQDDCWVINPAHRTNITSNSWGGNTIADEQTLIGMDFYSLLLDFLSAPDLLYDDYPGLIFLTAAGNSGPGYGTVHNPGTASMSITIGASTMYHFYQGNSGKNDVAFFSARGPTPYGAIKPDVVAPGHTGFVLSPVITGYGNGTFAVGTFGGTSEATPRAAGVVALIFEALVKQSRQPNLENVRLILKGTAINLGYHPTIQGNGLVNAYNAISSIYDGEQILVSSTYSSQLFGQRLQDAFGAMFLDEHQNNSLAHPLITNPIADTAISILPSELNSGINLSITFGNGTKVPETFYSSQTKRMVLTDSAEFDFISDATETTEINLENKWELNSQWKESDMIQISLSLDEPSWDGLFSTGLSTPNMILYDSETDELIADMASLRTWQQQLYSGIPGDDFSGDPFLRFSDPGYESEVPNWSGLTYNGLVQVFNNENWDSTTSTDTDGNIQLTGNSVVDELQFAMLEIQSTSATYQVPILIAAEEKVGFGEEASFVGDDLDIDAPYLLDSIYGSFDWGSYPTTGDFQYYRFSVPSNATYLAIQGVWEEAGLIPDFYLFNAYGKLVVTSDVTWSGGGYYESTTSEPFAQNILIQAEDTIYTLLVHVAQTPFTPGPFSLRIYSRYLTLETLPLPSTSFSQDITSPVSGELTLDSSNYVVSQFPELKVTGIAAQIFQGSNGSTTGAVNVSQYTGGVATELSMIESVEILEFKQGDKVKFELTWTNDSDIDIYVISPDQNFNLTNDLLEGQGATSNNISEIVSLGIEKSGNYSVYIDYVDAFADYNVSTYTLNWETRSGPTISNDGDNLTFDTSIFANGEYGIYITQHTNFNVYFASNHSLELINHELFTAELILPTPGSKSGEITVEWEASASVIASVFLKIESNEYLVADKVSEMSISFDSTLYPNGPAEIIVKLTDGVFQIVLNVGIELSNNFPSTLPPVKTTDSKSLPVLLVINNLLIIFVLAILRLKMNAKKIN